MKLSITIFAIIFLSLGNINAQNNTSPFLLDGPDDWRKEVLNLPLSFAPELDYKGIEYVRFSKGWGNANSEEFWTYKFAWYLDTDPKLTTDGLNKELKLYFDGLMQIVGKGKGLKKENITPTETAIAFNTDSNIYTGNVTIFDVFFKEAQQTLNVKITSTYCNALKKYIAYFEFSPQSYDHKLWDTMSQITIACK